MCRKGTIILDDIRQIRRYNFSCIGADMKTKVPLSLSDKMHLQDESYLKQQPTLTCNKFLSVDKTYGELYM